MRPPRIAPSRPRAALLAVVVVLLAACTSSSAHASPPAPGTVQVANFAFTPDSITVKVGDAVTWVFHQPEAPHNVVSLSGPAMFNSGTPQGKGTFRFTFTQPGTYTYVCQVHPNMRGTVIVTP